MTRVLCTLPYGLAIRNLVSAGVLQAIVDRGGELAVLSPTLAPRDEDVLRAELPAGTALLRLPRTRPSTAYAIVKMLKQHRYAERTKLRAFRVKYEHRRQLQPIFHRAADTVERASTWLLPERRIDSLLVRWRQPHERYFGDLLDQWRPDVVAVTKPGYHPDELGLIRTARARRIHSVAVDTTWDNMASKRPPYIRPDGLCVWNERMRLEAVECYRFSADDVAVTGGPQFDVFFQRDRLPPRREFLTDLGLDPERPLVVLTLNNPTLTPQNGAYVSLLAEAILSGAIRPAPNVIVRLHPWDPDHYDPSLGRGYRWLRFEQPFERPAPGTDLECLPTRQSALHYGAVMVHADLLLNIASTTTLDGIACDVPVINIAFDPVEMPEARSVRRFLSYTHYAAILESGAVAVASNAAELYMWVNRLMADRAIGSKERLQARQTFLTSGDGRSAVRVAEWILARGARP